MRSEASIATSVPVPIARPRSAWASAGASLTPSPTIATTRPSACRRRTTSAFSDGQDLGDDLVDADLGGDARARSSRCRRSAAPAAGRAPAARRRPRPTVGLTVSATTKTARGRAVPAGGDRGAAARLGGAARGVELGRQVHRPVGEQRRAADDDARGRRRRPRRRGPRGWRRPRRPAAAARRAPRGDRRAIGCSEASSSAPTSRSASLARRRRDATSTSAIRPVVTVPVLSSTTCRPRRVDSRTSGPLISRPSWAPRPVPTISAVGVARPSAQGQAMISTATAAVNAKVALSPAPSQKPSVATRERDHDRDEDARDAVGEPLDRRLAGLRVGHEPGDLRQRGVGADLRRADDQAAAGVDGRAGDLVARADLDRHRLAGEQARCRPPSGPPRRRRRWRPSRRGARRSGRRPASCSIGTRRSRRRRRARATSLAPSSSSAFSAAPARRLARASK